MKKFIEYLKENNSEVKANLGDLRDEIYNAEDVIDGVYNSEDVKYSDLTDINKRYKKLLADMNEFIEVLNSEINS